MEWEKSANQWEHVKKHGGVTVLIIAEIRNNETKEIRHYELEEPLYMGESFPSVWNWEENNYSCDCNRHLFFCRAGEEEEGEDEGICRGSNKYSVNLLNKKTKEYYYKEFNQ